MSEQYTKMSEMSEGKILAMQAIFELCDAVNSHDLNIADLADVMGFAITGGFANVSICLGMAMMAVEIANDGSSNPDMIPRVMLTGPTGKQVACPKLPSR